MQTGENEINPLFYCLSSGVDSQMSAESLSGDVQKASKALIAACCERTLIPIP
jgi:hypothetical protein